MDPLLKQRLVGASVMVGLAVIIIPTWLEQEIPAPALVVRRDMAPMPATDLPAAPVTLERAAEDEISSGMEASNAELAARIPALQPPPKAAAAAANSSVEATLASDLAQVPAATSAVAHAPTIPPAPAGAAADQAWVIQLGSFARRENAESLHAKLLKAGFTAAVVPLAERGKQSYRVRVGAKTDRRSAERLHARLAKDLGISGIVVRGD